MKTIKHIYLNLLIIILAILSLTTMVSASEITTDDFDIVNDNGNILTQLKDENTTTGIWFNENQSITVNTANSFVGVYIIWEQYPENGYTITGENGFETMQNTGFLQEYVSLDTEIANSITISTKSNSKILEILLVAQGELPVRVHNWEAPLEKADILLLPTHADDEHLFFGPVMPTYTERGDVAIQVAYMVNHSGEPYRQQEQLNGLWEAGVRNYPIIPGFADMYSSSLAHAKTIYSADEITSYISGLMERFSPQVVVGHDFAGEYGHGAHMLYAESLVKAIEITATPPQKVYIHLYEENNISLDIDTPLAAFDGRTALQVATDAFAHHRSQQTYFSVQRAGLYDMKSFGLYYTTVGVDTTNDMLENIVTYQEQEDIAKAEEEARLKLREDTISKVITHITDVDKIGVDTRIKIQEEQELINQENERRIMTYVYIGIAIIIIALVIAIDVFIKKRR